MSKETESLHELRICPGRRWKKSDLRADALPVTKRIAGKQTMNMVMDMEMDE
ncbi:MAG: hypothetical protein WC620_01415 [Methanoregula sp.]